MLACLILEKKYTLQPYLSIPSWAMPCTSQQKIYDHFFCPWHTLEATIHNRNSLMLKTTFWPFSKSSQKTSKRNKTWPWSIQYFPSFSVLVNLISSWKTQNFTLSKNIILPAFFQALPKNLKGHDLVSIATSFKHLYKCISAAILQPGGLLSDCSFQISSMTVHGLSIFQHPWTKPTPPFTSWTLAEQLFWLIVTKQQLHHDCPTN